MTHNHPQFERAIHLLLIRMLLPAGALVEGCSVRSPEEAQSITSAMDSRMRVQQGEMPARGEQRDAAITSASGASIRIAPLHRDTGSDRRMDGYYGGDEHIIALVDGAPISRKELERLLLDSYGAAILDQLIRLQLASAEVDRRGLKVTEADVEAEHDLTLRRLCGPLAAVSGIGFDSTATERLLDDVLWERNLTHALYDVMIRTNAHLRRVVESELAIGESDARAEFDRVFGRRVQVRHIQLATAAESARVRDRLRAGEEFASLATRYSADLGSAAAGGLLAPFSEHDERVPQLFRDTSFSLAVGEVSSTVRLGEWHHLIRVERFIPPDHVTFEQQRPEIERILRRRLAEPMMRSLLEELYRKANIKVHDSTLARELERIQGEDGG